MGFHLIHTRQFMFACGFRSTNKPHIHLPYNDNSPAFTVTDYYSDHSHCWIVQRIHITVTVVVNRWPHKLYG